MSHKFIIFICVLFAATACKKDGDSSVSPVETIPLPVINTILVGDVTNKTAYCVGRIFSEGSSEITAKGVCWSPYCVPTILNQKTNEGVGKNNFTSYLSGLTPNATYYIRAYATNQSGTSYGRAIFFRTQGDSTVSDIDGNVYHTVTLGSQVWMIENLKTTKFRNGEAINKITTSYISANNNNNGYYANYDLDENNATIYGRLYNGYAVFDNRILAPNGWHIPESNEWDSLISYLGGKAIAGKAMKEASNLYWGFPNNLSDNSSNFTALPGGSWSGTYDKFLGIGWFALFWSHNQDDNKLTAEYYIMSCDSTRINHELNMGKTCCLSVRCVSDNPAVYSK